MTMNRFSLSVAYAATSLACGIANSQPVTVNAGHTVLTLPPGLKAYSAPMTRQFTGGDPIRIDRQVVLLSLGDRAPEAAMLVESTREAGRYIWTDSCKQFHNNAHTFVYSPFHAMANECTVAVGPLDLTSVIGESFADVEQTLRAGGQSVPAGVGYVVRSTYASWGGSMLSATVFVREPLARLSTAPETMPDDTGVPTSVVAWARALNDQVRGAMLSISGAWQLPPLNGKNED